MRGGVGWPGPGAVALEQARRAARVGVGLETVLRRYVLGSSLLGEVIMEEADRGEGDWSCPPLDRRGALRGALRAQASVLDRLLQAVTVAYGDELRRAGRSPEQRRVELVRGLLDGDALERPELDYDLDGWHLGVIAVGHRRRRGSSASWLGESIDGCLSVSHGGQSVWAWLGGSERLAFADVERVLAGMAAGATGEGVVFALGEPAKGLAGWRLTHRQAQAALVVALRGRAARGAATRYAMSRCLRRAQRRRAGEGAD